MATHDYVLDNATGANFRSDLNNALAAIVSNNSSSSEPSTKYAYQWWADTNEGVLKIRNSSNDGWVTLLQLDGTLTLEDGTNSAPALGFRDDLNTGIFSSAADTLDITCGGTTRGSFSSSGLAVTGNVTATTFVGALTGAATRITNTNEASDTTCFPVFTTSATGDLLPRTNANLGFNASNGTLSATTFSGSGASLTALNIVTDTSPQLGGDLDTNSQNISVTGGNNITMGDNSRLRLGASNDLDIFHDGTDNHIIGGSTINIDTGAGEEMAKFITNGAVELYYDNTKRFQTTSSGATVTGNLSATTNFKGDDNVALALGTGTDFRILHDGTNNVITSDGGQTIRIVNHLSGGNESMLECVPNDATKLYFNGSTKLATTSGGVSVTGNASFADNGEVVLGSSSDLILRHIPGSRHEILGAASAQLQVRCDEQLFLSENGTEDLFRAVKDGAFKAYFDASQKLETTSSGINVTGAITVNGSALSTGGGKLLQVISANKPDQFDTTSTSFVDVASLSVDITAASSSNKMLVTCHVFANCEDAAVLRLMFDSTPVGNGQGGDGGVNNQGFAMVRQDDGNLGSGYGIQILHTPGDTSQHTYKIQARATSSSNQLVINRRSDNLNYCLASSITVEEISA